MLFPEGERKSGPLVQPLFDGAVYVALKAGVPIVPVGIGGSERVMPKGAKFIYPRKVHVVIGAPIRLRSRPTGGRLPRTVVQGAHRPAPRRAAAAVRPCPMDAVPWATRSTDQADPAEERGSSARAAECRWVVDAAQLAGRVHRQLGDADVDGGDAEAGGRDRSDRRAARHVVAGDERLHAARRRRRRPAGTPPRSSADVA